MILLGFDTATPATAVALRLADGTSAERRDDPREGEHPGHATRLLPLAGKLLVEAGAGWETLTRIAVGTGPGRFTGLRVGVATARGLAQSLGVEVVGVSSLRALAHGAAQAHRECPLLAVIDARRGEVFAAACFFGSGSEHPDRDAAEEVDFGAPLRPGELAAAVARANELGSAAGGCVAIGDGALRYRDELERAGATVPADGDAAHLIRAEAICTLALDIPAVAAGEVVPDYRREADAAIARAAIAPAGKV